MCGNRGKKGEGESLEEEGDEGQRGREQGAAGRVGEISHRASGALGEDHSVRGKDRGTDGRRRIVRGPGWCVWLF